jgi:hypothetical protein
VKFPPPRYRVEYTGGRLVEWGHGGHYARRSKADTYARQTVAAEGKTVIVFERVRGEYVERERIEPKDMAYLVHLLVAQPEPHERRDPVWHEEQAEDHERRARRCHLRRLGGEMNKTLDVFAGAWAWEARRARVRAAELRDGRRSR